MVDGQQDSNFITKKENLDVRIFLDRTRSNFLTPEFGNIVGFYLEHSLAGSNSPSRTLCYRKRKEDFLAFELTKQESRGYSILGEVPSFFVFFFLSTLKSI
jgi:hypothetical protein